MVYRDNGASTYCLKEDTRLIGPWEFGKKSLGLGGDRKSIAFN